MASSAPPAYPTIAAEPGHTLRSWGALVFLFFLITSAVGGSLALESSYLVVTLASHIGLALVTLALAGYGASRLGRAYQPLPRASAGLAAFCALGATIAGTLFLAFDQNHAALLAMEGFAVVGLLAAILMMAFGGPSGRRTPATS
jgi:hypothetical protein